MKEESIEESWIKVKRFLAIFLVSIFAVWILILVLWNVIVDLGVGKLEHGVVDLILIIPVFVVVIGSGIWILTYKEKPIVG